MLKSNLRTRRSRPSVKEVRAGAVKVALKEEIYQYLSMLSATTWTRMGQSVLTPPVRHLIFKFEFRLMFQYPARRWLDATKRRVIARTGLGANTVLGGLLISRLIAVGILRQSEIFLSFIVITGSFGIEREIRRIRRQCS